MPKLIAIITALIFSAGSVFAAGFQLDSIGNLNSGGQLYPEWWYQGHNPTLNGKSSPNEPVEITISGESQTINADDNGNWSHAPTTLTDGSHQISITSLGSTISFTLHINQAMPAGAGSPAAPEQPIAGNFTLTLSLLALGAILLVAGLRLTPAYSTITP